MSEKLCPRCGKPLGTSLTSCVCGWGNGGWMSLWLDARNDHAHIEPTHVRTARVMRRTLNDGESK